MAMILKSITLLFHVKHFDQKKFNPPYGCHYSSFPHGNSDSI
jgi:hypothetical protein